MAEWPDLCGVDVSAGLRPSVVTGVKCIVNTDLKPDVQTPSESAHGLYVVLAPDPEIVAVSNAYLKATKTKLENIVGYGVFERR